MKILVYGAGENCRKVLKKIQEKGEVLCIADKDSEKIGKSVDGYPIVAVEDMNGYDYELIIVSIVEHFNDVKKELVEKGYSENKIIHWKNYINIAPKYIGTMIADWNGGVTANNLYDELCNHVDELSNMEKEFLVGKHNRSFKWLHYFEVYNRHFGKYIGKDVTILEIGVNKGGSLQIWKKVLGPKAKIIGVDITPACKELEEEQISIYIGNQADRNFWKKMKEEIPKVDILIDDGGHYMEQQIVTFEEMFGHVKEDGIYICEDTGSSYNPEKYNSGYKKENTFIEYSKNFVDYIHAWFSREEALQISEYSRSMHSLHYYPGILVIEKHPMFAPFDMEICNNDEEKYAVCHFHGEI
ncbi:8-demethyl-8-alpha-L-rhamnosyl tetracenomycin-C 2'-O-methyltransferase [Lachnospiraceae bacterium]|nr:8-demethyl-8-alpha-L-rhamnosyl tetracenomycin-C 2'-O-methyltransferase [Lachnospiraceae bacterium]